MIRAVDRYNDSAKIEAEIILEIQRKESYKHNIVYLKEYFTHEDKEGKHRCLVFETLGKSLFDFIKSNKYKGRPLSFQCIGYCLSQIQSFARQSLEALAFMHAQELTHTDLKVRSLI